MTETFQHYTVMLKETVDGLNIKPDGVYVDCTLGGAGHSEYLLSQLSSKGHLYAFDQDQKAIDHAKLRLASYVEQGMVTFIKANFRELEERLSEYVDKVDGILYDLGVSSPQLDEAERGFSYHQDAPLDMRMNQRSRVSAVEVLNEYTEEQLADVFYLYGELTQARRLARAIATARRSAAITQVSQLMAVAEPLLDRRRAKKELACVFQALRIEVNGELDALKEFLSQTAAVIRPGGRLAIITYHSLEDRLVKNFMRTGNFAGKVETDLFGRSERPFRPVGSKPTVADEAEIERNPRSRSAKLRVAERI